MDTTDSSPALSLGSLLCSFVAPIEILVLSISALLQSIHLYKLAEVSRQLLVS